MSSHDKSAAKPAVSPKNSRGLAGSRALARSLDGSGVPIWLIGMDGRLAYFSEGADAWLGFDTQTLIGRTSVAGSPISDDPLDYLAASLSPPPGLSVRGTASLKIEPPQINRGRKADDGSNLPWVIQPLDVRFIRIGSPSSYQVLAIGGRFEDAKVDDELRDAVLLRQHLDGWRKRHATIATIATAGNSSSARRLRARLEVASSLRTHVGFFGPQGCEFESIASRVHQQSAAGEPIVTVEGPLMDAELLDATLMPLIHRLADSDQSTGTALVRGLDEMPLEAQHRFIELVDHYQTRLRMLAICSRQPEVLREPIDELSSGEEWSSLDDDIRVGLLPRLIDRLSSLTVTMEPLKSRVDDIPLMATAALDARRAAHEGTAERFSRAALDALVVYPWPGNVHELIDAIGHAARHAHRDSIAVEHLPLAIRSFRAGDAVMTADAEPVLPLDEAMRRFERQRIQQAVATTHGNRAEAARRLGISRARLIRRLSDETTSEESTERSK